MSRITVSGDFNSKNNSKHSWRPLFLRRVAITAYCACLSVLGLPHTPGDAVAVPTAGSPEGSAAVQIPPSVVPSPVPSPPPVPECPWSVISTRGYMGPFSGVGSTLNLSEVFTPFAQVPNCLADLVLSSIALCFAENYQDGELQYGFDDCVIIEVYSNLFNSRTIGNRFVWTSAVFLDSSCNVIPDNGQASCSRQTFAQMMAPGQHGYYHNASERCLAGCGGVFDFITTPISLVLDDTHDIDSEITFTQFPLDPRGQSRWFAWKGSEKAPLLVYDPKHTGQVISAQQLFGDWTFGGQRLASLAGLSNRPLPWDNGYQALASLDANGDGEISGAELQPLALWYDNNRDGISQSGEVVPIESAEITRLFYSNLSTDEASGDIVAEKGFERLVDGEVVPGRSIDWFAQGASTKFELVAKLAERGNLGKIAAEERHEPAAEVSKYNPESKLRGAWRWTIKEGNVKGKVEPGGFLVFEEFLDKTITGFSLIELSLPVAGKTPPTALTTVELTGTVEGQGVFKFRSKTKNGTETESTVSLIKPDLLLGKSVTKSKLKGKDVSFSYTWEATRVVGK